MKRFHIYALASLVGIAGFAISSDGPTGGPVWPCYLSTEIAVDKMLGADGCQAGCTSDQPAQNQNCAQPVYIGGQECVVTNHNDTYVQRTRWPSQGTCITCNTQTIPYSFTRASLGYYCPD